jgi:hypothetical protein
MSDFLTELEEDIREEQLFTLWHKYGNIIICIALSIILTTAGYTLWSYLKKRTQLSHYTSFSHAINLLNEGKKEEALRQFQDLSQHSDGYGKLAQLYEATLVSDPSVVYEKLAQKNTSDPALGNLPKILIASHSLHNPTTLSALHSLSAPHNAWAPLSLELLGLAALEKGDSSKAAEYYIRALKESFLTPEEQKRLSLMLAQLDVPASVLQGIGQ